MSSILGALASHASHRPDHRAITGSSEGLDWQQLASQVDALAGQLSGVRSLGLLLGNSPAWIVADLAALQAGCQHIPLPGFFTDEQLLHAVTDAAVDTIITDQPGRIAALFPDGRQSVLGIGQASLWMRRLRTDAHAVEPGVAKITYTSGTTGAPRGVKLSCDALETVATSLEWAAQAAVNDRAMVLLPLSVLLENIGSVYTPLLAGAEIVVPDAQETGLSGSSHIDAAKLARTLHKYRPTSLIVPPGLLRVLVQLAHHQPLPDSLRFIAVGGAPTGRGLLDAAEQLGLPVYQGYGLSEACSVVCVNTPLHNRPGSVGRVLPHAGLRISETGEILVQGTGFSGYLHGPERDPCAPLATGDIGHIDADGFLYVTGRISEQIITSFGRNVSPEWIESELLSDPAIAQAAVIGNKLPCLVAVLVPNKGINPSTFDSVIKATNARLPDYANIGAWLPASEPFSVARGELTPAGSLRRAVIEREYSPLINKHYATAHAQLF